MGVLNVTPDSFSDGGKFLDAGAAAAHAAAMVAAGADLVDVGGESTRPGAQPVDAAEQRRRVVPVIERIVRETGAAVSVDTSLVEVADAAVDAGAVLVNDVTAGRDPRNGADGALLRWAARRAADGVPVAVALMHMQGEPGTMQRDPRYGDVVAEVLAFLLQRAAAAEAAGVRRADVVIDPGIGFGKTAEHNLALLGALPRFVGSGYPVLLGTSRKRTLRMICTRPGRDPSPDELAAATCATTALAVAAGVAIVRVHDVRENRDAADVAWAVRRGQLPGC